MEAIHKVKLRLSGFFRKRVNRDESEPIRIYKKNETFYMVFRKPDVKDGYTVAQSFDGFDFDVIEKPDDYEDAETYLKGAVVESKSAKLRDYIYAGERQICLGKKTKNGQWRMSKKPLLISASPMEPAGAFEFPHGIVLVYYEKTIVDGHAVYNAYVAEFDTENPDEIAWKTEQPIWSSATQFGKRAVRPIGAVRLKDAIVLYWHVDGKVISGVHLTSFHFDPSKMGKHTRLQKYAENPILAVRAEYDWEAFTTMNPAAAYIDGKVHILYRAQGYDYVSTVGYAVSSDGYTISNRSEYPVYTPSANFETNTTGTVNPNLMSAGGYGGVEDPRVTVIGDRLYMVYVAFNGWDSVRLAMTSINVFDFLAQRWNWEKPVLISPPHIIDKSGCLLPEKINGKYVFFHRIFPNILIDYVDDLNFSDGKVLKGQYSIKVRPDKWDSRKIGAGAPPIKTDDGWLLIYYGVDDKDASKYHIGAMLLDRNDPTKVLHRTDKPILSPTEHYENHGFKPGIAYPCGAVVVKGELLVYYGAADQTVCVAKADLKEFVDALKSNKVPKIEPLHIKEVVF